jgi:hypothetical protein
MKLQTTEGEKRALGIGILVLIIFALLLFKCNTSGDGGATETIAITNKEVVHDTSFIPVPDTIFYPKEKLRFKWDTLWINDDLLIANEIEHPTFNYREDYFATRVYKDTIKNQYGKVIINDTISQNKIMGRNVKTDLNIPIVTKTVTLIQPKRSQLYFGGGLFGNETKVLSGYEAGLMFKTKQDRILSLSYNQIFNGQHYYKASVYFKLSFRKQ